MSGVLRGSRLVQWGSTVAWAIVPESLAQMAEVATREPLTPDGLALVAQRLGRPLDNAHEVELRGPVAVMPVMGPIFRYANAFTAISGGSTVEHMAQDFARVLADPGVAAIVLSVDSPGGEATGIAEFAAQIRAARGVKPVVAYVGGDCCSAAYWLASAADEVVIDSTAQVGSIGAVMATPNPDASGKAPLRLIFTSSQSPLKNPDPRTEAGRSSVQARVDALAEVFIADVAANRDLTRDAVAATEGEIFVGQAAIRMGLADGLGSFEGVIARLQEEARRPRHSGTGGRLAASQEGISMAQEQAQRGRFERFMGWIAGEGDDAAFAGAVVASQGPAPAPAPALFAPNNGIPAVAATPDPRVAELEAQIARMQAEAGERARGAIAGQAAAFAEAELVAGRLTPAEREGLVAAYADAATDDLDHPRAEGQPSRVARLGERQGQRPAHGLTGEAVATREGLTLLPNLRETAFGPEAELAEGRDLDPAGRERYLGMTELGREALARRQDGAAG